MHMKLKCCHLVCQVCSNMVISSILRHLQDSLDHYPMPINADQNCGIDPNVDQFRSMHFGSMPWFWSTLRIDQGSLAFWKARSQYRGKLTFVLACLLTYLLMAINEDREGSKASSIYMKFWWWLIWNHWACGMWMYCIWLVSWQVMAQYALWQKCSQLTTGSNVGKVAIHS